MKTGRWKITFRQPFYLVLKRNLTLLEGSTTESLLCPSVTTTKTRGTASAAGRAPFVSENPSFTALVIANPVLVPPT